MRLGIVGLPNVGKSTLFNAITQGGAEAANYPFCTIDPNVGVVPVPDERLAILQEIYQSKAVIPAVVEMVDIAGLVKGAGTGEGMGNKFLSHIREVDALVHVVRGFEDENVTHVYTSVDPIRDIEIIRLELIISDWEMVERRHERVLKANKSPKKPDVYPRELEVLEILQVSFKDGICARHIVWDNPEDEKYMQTLNLLTAKPVLYAVNVLEDEILTGNQHVKTVEDFVTKENSKVFSMCAKIEEEISALAKEDKMLFLQDLGLEQSGLDKIVAAGYELLGLISFLTAGPKEVRAWTITKGLKAPQAAGKIHSDMEKGFIRAEVVSFDDLHRLGSHTKAKENGLVRIEGKDYAFQDGDVVLIRFNV
ncbi:MAG: redox-regulated ATPase YchF [Defluviitaleaceae bacterium]|nr:redox-regulated ATPase YchF [Defluviitaleaceae bacterium]